MGTTGILISKNIKFKVLPSINASLSDFAGAKNQPKHRHFCMDFHLRTLSLTSMHRQFYATSFSESPRGFVRLGNLNFDFKIRISDLKSNVKSENGFQR